MLSSDIDMMNLGVISLFGVARHVEKSLELPRERTGRPAVVTHKGLVCPYHTGGFVNSLGFPKTILVWYILQCTGCSSSSRG